MENSQSPAVILTNNQYDMKEIVSKLELKDLRIILNSIRADVFGDKQVLCNRILNLLTGDTPLSQSMKQEIIQLHIFNRTQLQNPLYSEDVDQNPFFQDPLSDQSNKNHDFIATKLNLNFTQNIPFFKTIISFMRPFYCKNNAIYTFEVTKMHFIRDNPMDYINNSYDINKKEHKAQIVLRLHRGGAYADDHLPSNLKVTVNNHECNLPTLNMPKRRDDEPWRVSVPIDITKHLDLRKHVKNKLQITWSNDSFYYIAGVFLTEKLTWENLIVKLKNKPVRITDETIKLIKKSMDNETDMGVDCLCITLKDPLSTLRMKLPVRGKECIHLQCFDAIQFLQMNEQKQTWICPICKKRTEYNNMEIDEYFLNIIQSSNLSEECEKVVLFENGTWDEKKIKRINYSDCDNNEESNPKRMRLNSNLSEEKPERIASANGIIMSNNRSGPSSSTGLTDVLNDVNLPNITISGANINDNKARTSIYSISKKSQEKAKLRPVLYVITLD